MSTFRKKEDAAASRGGSRHNPRTSASSAPPQAASSGAALSSANTGLPPAPGYNSLVAARPSRRGSSGRSGSINRSEPTSNNAGSTGAAKGTTGSDLAPVTNNSRRRGSASEVNGDRSRPRGSERAPPPSHSSSHSRDTAGSAGGGGGDHRSRNSSNAPAAAASGRGGGGSSSSRPGRDVSVVATAEIEMDASDAMESGHRTVRSSGGPGPPRVVHRVGMECLSPINVARGDGMGTGGESFALTHSYQYSCYEI